MKLSTASWPYRLYVWLWEHPPKDLCRLFWGCIVAVLLAPVVLAVVGMKKLPSNARKVVVGVFIAANLVWLGVTIVLAVIENPWNLLFIPALMVGVFLLLGALFLGLDWMHHRRKNRAGSSSSGVVRSYLKARKRRVCPLIEVVEE